MREETEKVGSLLELSCLVHLGFEPSPNPHIEYIYSHAHKEDREEGGGMGHQANVGDQTMNRKKVIGK